MNHRGLEAMDHYTRYCDREGHHGGRDFFRAWRYGGEADEMWSPGPQLTVAEIFAGLPPSPASTQSVNSDYFADGY